MIADATVSTFEGRVELRIPTRAQSMTPSEARALGYRLREAAATADVQAAVNDWTATR